MAIVLVLVLVLVAAVYLPALGGSFLWDDRRLIIESSLIDSTTSLGDYLSRPFWTREGSSTDVYSYYRPLVPWSFAFDHRLHGVNAGGFHLTNVLIHLLNTGLVFALLRRAGTRGAVSALLALGWALLPRLAEAAAWISGRTDALAATFVLLALLVWNQSAWRRIASAALMFGGLLAKESALALLPALAVLELVRAREARQHLWNALLRTWPLLVAVAAYLPLRYAAVGQRFEGAPLGASRPLVVLEAIGTYGAMLVDAWRPRAVIGRLGPVTVPGVLAGVTIVLGVGYGIWRARGRLTDFQWLGLVLALASLFPVTHVWPIPLRTLAADRFLYLPTIGLCLLLARPLAAWLGERRPAWLAAGALVASLAVVSVGRVKLWSDEVEFWVQTYLETPRTNAAAATELFGVYYRAALYEDAVRIAERASTYDDPHGIDARYNAALALTRLGRYEEALAKLRTSRPSRKTPGDVAFQIAVVKVAMAKFAQARLILDELVKEKYAEASTLRAFLPALEGAAHELAVLPDTAPPEHRARLVSMLGRHVEAARAWSEVVRSPSASEALLAEALLYLVQSGDRGAIEAASQALTRKQGKLSPELAAMVELRLDELERLVRARERWSAHIVAP